MDRTINAIATFVDEISHEQLSPSAVHETKRRFVDTLACGIGGIGAPPAEVARTVAASTIGRTRSATVIALESPTSVENAAFANTVMVRYLDFNDMTFTERGGGGHPSDLLPTALSVGESVGASGIAVLLASVIAYEVNGSLAGAVWLRPRGWDQGLHIVAASSTAASKLLGLNRTQIGNALSLAVTANIPTRQTRVGELSMWKGCATAGAARAGIFAALLAEQGMTGPPDAFEGKAGIWNQVTGRFEVTIPVKDDSFVIEEVATKMLPAEYNAQGPLELVFRFRDKVDVEDIEEINVETYFLAYDEIGSEPEKWDPHTRETADHSLAYLIAVALVDGEVTSRSFTQERILDPALRPLMNKIKIHENPAFTEAFPQEINCRITVELKSGPNLSEHLEHPQGHHKNPASDEQLNRKFDSMVAEYRPASEARLWNDLRETLWNLDDVKNVASIMEPLRTVRPT